MSQQKNSSTDWGTIVPVLLFIFAGFRVFMAFTNDSITRFDDLPQSHDFQVPYEVECDICSELGPGMTKTFLDDTPIGVLYTYPGLRYLLIVEDGTQIPKDLKSRIERDTVQKQAPNHLYLESVSSNEFLTEGSHILLK